MDDIKLRDYQNQAIKQLKDNNWEGIYEMATGERVIIVTGCSKCFNIKGFRNLYQI